MGSYNIGILERCHLLATAMRDALAVEKMVGDIHIAQSPDALIEAAQQTRLHMVIVDLDTTWTMAGWHTKPSAVVTWLRQLNSEPEVLAISGTLDPSRIARLLRSGASGHLDKNTFDACELRQAVKAAQRGRLYLCPATRLALMAPQGRRSPLTEREVQIVEWMEHLLPEFARGSGFSRHLTRWDIADRLFITKGTLDVHIANIGRKLNVRGDRLIVERCRELGWLE